MLNKKRFKNLVVSKKTTTFASLFDQSTDVRICFYLGEMVESLSLRLTFFQTI